MKKALKNLQLIIRFGPEPEPMRLAVAAARPFCFLGHPAAQRRAVAQHAIAIMTARSTSPADEREAHGR
jgi:hypothetical protein